MKASKFSAAQKAFILKQGSGRGSGGGHLPQGWRATYSLALALLNAGP